MWSPVNASVAALRLLVISRMCDPESGHRGAGGRAGGAQDVACVLLASERRVCGPKTNNASLIAPALETDCHSSMIEL
jgi:hypothetical protein